MTSVVAELRQAGALSQERGFASTPVQRSHFTLFRPAPPGLRRRDGVQLCSSAPTGATASLAGSNQSLQDLLTTPVDLTPLPVPLAMEGQEINGQKKFDWMLQWYPINYVANLDPAIPHPFTLLQQRIVLFRDASGVWRTLLDSCPHRFAPLSEGRVEADGSLMCSYHGWRFSGADGKCMDVPQSLDAKANARACASSRSCAKSFPTRVWQGKVWVFATGGPEGNLESALVKPALIPEWPEDTNLMDREGNEVLYTLQPYCRDVPYDYSILGENLTDPSHVNFSHHGVIGDRSHEMSGYVKIGAPRRSETAPSPQDSFIMEVENYHHRMKTTQKWPLRFAAPSLTQWRFTMPWGAQTWLNIYMVPTVPGKARALVETCTLAKATPWFIALMMRARPAWAGHIADANKIFDGDGVFLYGQGYNMAEKAVRGEQQGSTWRSYYMPAQADRYIAKFKQWLEVRGSGGPTPFREGDALPPLESRKEVLLERFRSHTLICASCRKAYKRFEEAKVAMAALGALCFLGLAAALGRGVALASVPVAVFAAGIVATLAAWCMLKSYAGLFHYWDYSHATNNVRIPA